MNSSLANQKWFAIGLSVSISAVPIILLVSFSVNVIQEYGYLLFTLVPFVLGLLSSVIYGYFESRSFKACLKVSLKTLLPAAALLILFNIEGLICVIMATPLVSIFVIAGAAVGYVVQDRNKRSVIRIYSLSLLLVPSSLLIENQYLDDKPEVIPVTTSVIINAPVEVVWENVIEFPEIPDPEEWIFKTGIAYPISAKIDGDSVGAVRYCAFTTGQFVEPIETWDAPNLLQFSVMEQPIPLKRMIGEEVPAYMFKYFASTKGEFRLSKINAGQTLLEGTTWYYLNVKPGHYWQIWSDFIIHSIHERVLAHIKVTSEQ